MPKHLVVARLAQQASYEPGVVVVIHRQLPALAGGSLADEARLSLVLVQALVLVGCDAVGALDVLSMARSLQLFPPLPVVGSAPPSRVRYYAPVSGYSLLIAVFAAPPFGCQAFQFLLTALRPGVVDLGFRILDRHAVSVECQPDERLS